MLRLGRRLRPLAPRGARLLADAVTPYRQLVGATAVQREEWAAADAVLHSRMREHVVSAANANPHSRTAT